MFRDAIYQLDIAMVTREFRILGHVMEESGIIIDRQSQSPRLTIIG
jgi:hypothetical protein